MGDNKTKPINLFLTKNYFNIYKKSLITIYVYQYIKLKF